MQAFGLTPLDIQKAANKIITQYPRGPDKTEAKVTADTPEYIEIIIERINGPDNRYHLHTRIYIKEEAFGLNIPKTVNDNPICADYIDPHTPLEQQSTLRKNGTPTRLKDLKSPSFDVLDRILRIGISGHPNLAQTEKTMESPQCSTVRPTNFDYPEKSTTYTFLGTYPLPSKYPAYDNRG